MSLSAASKQTSLPRPRRHNGIVCPRVHIALSPANFYASNILQIPFRRSRALSLSDAITQYVSTKYDQHPDMFAEDLMIIDRLRNEAIHVQEPHVSGISRLVTYAAQLKWLGGKFPIDVSGTGREVGYTILMVVYR